MDIKVRRSIVEPIGRGQGPATFCFKVCGERACQARKTYERFGLCPNCRERVCLRSPLVPWNMSLNQFPAESLVYDSLHLLPPKSYHFDIPLLRG
jgi:hypothetical protein